METKTSVTDIPAGKRLYEKPELKSFSLVAEEVMGGTCKADLSPGPNTASCVSTNCTSIGS